MKADIVELLTAFLDSRQGVRYDSRTGEFVWNSNGRVVSQKRILTELEQVEKHYKANIARHTEKFTAGDITLPQWQKRMRKEVADVHRTQYIIGRGGRGSMTQRDWGRLGSSLRWNHYRALDNFAGEIAAGNMTPGQIQVRAGMYASSSNNNYWNGRTEAKIAAGMDLERRRLNPAEHCNDCVRYAAMGWQPLGTLPEPGEASVCGPNCRCSKEYTRSDQLG